VIWDQFW